MLIGKDLLCSFTLYFKGNSGTVLFKTQKVTFAAWQLLDQKQDIEKERFVYFFYLVSTL
jgi:hypothetical protein